MTNQDILHKLKKLDGTRMLVLGDSMLDIYDFCYSSTSRPSPEKPGKMVYTSHRSLWTLGGAANVAANLASLGVKTNFISATGHDAHFFTLKDLCDKEGISHFLVQDSGRPTTTKFRLYIDDEYMLRRDDECAENIDSEIEASISSEFMRELSGCSAVVISDYNKGFFTKSLASLIISECRKKGIPVIVDFKPANRELFKGADVVAPNSVEAAALVDGFSPTENLPASLEKLHKILECRNVVVTLGEHGICGFDGRNFYHHNAHKVKALDAVGCGDTVRAGLAVGFALELGLDNSLALANAAASVVVQKTGTATVSAEELAPFFA